MFVIVSASWRVLPAAPLLAPLTSMLKMRTDPCMLISYFLSGEIMGIERTHSPKYWRMRAEEFRTKADDAVHAQTRET